MSLEREMRHPGSDHQVGKKVPVSHQEDQRVGQLLSTFINCVVRALNADWLKAVVYQTYTMGMTD
jgi:hypothetical protein